MPGEARVQILDVFDLALLDIITNGYSRMYLYFINRVSVSTKENWNLEMQTR